MELSQVLALAIFAAMYLAIIVGQGTSHIPALLGAALTLVLVFFTVLRDHAGVLNYPSLERSCKLTRQLQGTLASHETT